MAIFLAFSIYFSLNNLVNLPGLPSEILALLIFMTGVTNVVALVINASDRFALH